MKIEWNKVTWYSKWIALLLFIAFPFIGFCLGMKYGELIAPIEAINLENATGTVTMSPEDYYNVPGEWQTDTHADGGFSIAAPTDFTIDAIYSNVSVSDWSELSSGVMGLKMFTVGIPAAFEPQTNLAGATLSVGKSSASAAITNCLQPEHDERPGMGYQATTTINGITFSITKFSGAGAGNLYDTTTYRTLRANACWSVEYTIHSTQLANWPAAYQLKQFDAKKLTDVLDLMVGTFKFQ